MSDKVCHISRKLPRGLSELMAALKVAEWRLMQDRTKQRGKGRTGCIHRTDSLLAIVLGTWCAWRWGHMSAYKTQGNEGERSRPLHDEGSGNVSYSGILLRCTSSARNDVTRPVSILHVTHTYTLTAKSPGLIYSLELLWQPVLYLLCDTYSCSY